MAYPEGTEDGKVICQLCGKEYQLITPSHLKNSHNTTYDEYRKLFPKAFLTSQEYKVKRKYVKFDTFKDSMEKLADYNLPPVQQYEPTPIPEPEEDYGDDVHKNKKEILIKLQQFFPALINNYQIEIRNPIGHLEYQFITDMADPISKTDFEFPAAIWHNRDIRPVSTRDKLLQDEGWRTVLISTTFPKIEDIKPHLDIVEEDCSSEEPEQINNTNLDRISSP